MAAGGHQQKSAYYQALKELDVPFSKEYRQYTVEELKDAYDLVVATAADNGVVMPRVPLALTEQPEPVEVELPPDLALPPLPPLPERKPELPGQRLNEGDGSLQVIRVDEKTGRQWYQEEVLKPQGAKPRGRRVLTQMHGDTTVTTVQQGQFIETFETETGPATHQTTTKITLPSYQVGICKDPRFPWKVHTYNGLEGFDLFDVANYYGGAELVPAECKRVYVENVLCYDMRTVIRAVQTEYRHHQLTGKI